MLDQHLTLKLDAGVKHRYRIAAAIENLSLSAWVRRHLDAALLQSEQAEPGRRPPAIVPSSHSA